MEKNAEFIRKKEFHIVFKGYKPEEVDKFLDILSMEFDRMIKKNRELQESLDKLKFENTVEDTDIKKIIQDALISAHKVAEDIKTQAKQEADAIIDQRKNEEEKTLENLKKQKFQVEESILILQSKYEEIKTRMKKLTEEVNQFIEAVDVSADLQKGDSFELAKDDNNLLSENEEELADEDAGSGKEPENIIQEPGESAKEELEQDRDKKQGEQFSDFSSFDKYNINTEKEGSYYFEKIGKQEIKDKNNEQVIQKHEEEKIVENSIEAEPDTSKDAAESEPQTEKDEDSFNEDNPKRERKKIDIANPDIIENFFRASDD
jgi:cell division initiation protein